MPRFTDADVSSDPLERPKSRGNRGLQIECDTSAHMSRREGLLGVFDPIVQYAPMPARRSAALGVVGADDGTRVDRDTVIHDI